MSKTIVSTFGTFTDKELQVLKKGLKEMSDVMTMMESQKEAMKDIMGSIYDELKIPKKILRKMAKTYHVKNFSEVLNENQEFELLYSEIVDNNS